MVDIYIMICYKGSTVGNRVVLVLHQDLEDQINNIDGAITSNSLLNIRYINPHNIQISPHNALPIEKIKFPIPNTYPRSAMKLKVQYHQHTQ